MFIFCVEFTPSAGKLEYDSIALTDYSHAESTSNNNKLKNLNNNNNSSNNKNNKNNNNNKNDPTNKVLHTTQTMSMPGDSLLFSGPRSCGRRTLSQCEPINRSLNRIALAFCVDLSANLFCGRAI